MAGRTQIFVTVLLVFSALLLAGCDRNGESARRTAISSGEQVEGIQLEGEIVPTIYPSRTIPATSTPKLPAATSTPSPTTTPIDYQQIAVVLRYHVPGIGLDRSISANISSQIELKDAATDEVVNISNQPHVLIELQQVLKDIELEPVPSNCTMCVRIEYELPMAGESGSGWLQDKRLLASLENYTAVLMGPHFPVGTIMGLRRSATLFHAAHTVALTEDGQVWHWKANDSRFESPGVFEGDLISLLNARDDLDPETLRNRYVTTCPQGPGFEELYLPGGEEDINIRLTCPELTLPGSLLPIYVQLDALVNEYIELDQTQIPEPTVPLSATLQFKRSDGLNLTIFQDNSVSVIDAQGQVFTGTISNTIVSSVTHELITRELLQPGVVDTLEQTWANNIFVRGQGDVYETGWFDEIRPELADFLAWLEDLIVQIQLPPQEEEVPNNGAPTPSPTPTGEADS